MRDQHSISCTDECIDALEEAVEFSTLDAYSGYWYVEVDKADRDKTTFMSYRGL